jgi:hypothetical protein
VAVVLPPQLPGISGDGSATATPTNSDLEQVLGRSGVNVADNVQNQPANFCHWAYTTIGWWRLSISRQVASVLCLCVTKNILPAMSRLFQNIVAIKGSLLLAAGLLFWDVGSEGFYTFSLLICPLWFLISLVKNAIGRPGWGIAVFRISIPVVTLAIAMTNAELQWKVSDANAERVIKACEEFHLANGRFPKTLDELVPKYFPSVPPAKHCLAGNFWYFNSDGHCTLMWSRYGFYRRIYDFDDKTWGNID